MRTLPCSTGITSPCPTRPSSTSDPFLLSSAEKSPPTPTSSESAARDPLRWDCQRPRVTRDHKGERDGSNSPTVDDRRPDRVSGWYSVDQHAVCERRCATVAVAD